MNAMTDTHPTTEAGDMLALLAHPALKAMPADVAAAFGSLFANVQQIKDTRDRYKAALQRIADADYRGNRSTESVIALEALHG